MQYSFMAKTAQTCVTMDNLDLLSDNDVSKDREKREDCWQSTFAIYDQKRHMVDFKTIGEIAHACPSLVCMGDDYHFVSAIDQLGGELIDVALDSTGLRKEKIADHGNIIRHFGGEQSVRHISNAVLLLETQAWMNRISTGDKTSNFKISD